MNNQASQKLVEFVPNISEGRNLRVVKEIVDAAAVPGTYLLGVDSGWGANRTVVTILGEPEAIELAAFNLIERAAELIDMRQHTGVHPCIGAADVCPFVPYQNVTMAECSEMARRVGERVRRELSVPVYLYGQTTGDPQHRSLPTIRRGGYSALESKLGDPLMKPDLMPRDWRRSAGASIIGARDFLVAFNINLDTDSAEIARKIAGRIRASGFTKLTDKGPVAVAGRLPHCLAIGWSIEEYGIAQVSTNLINYRTTGMHHAFDEASRVAAELGTAVSGCELVGLVPQEALVAAGRHAASQLNRSGSTSPEFLMQQGVRYLGLSDKYVFVIEDKVLEERVKAVLH